MNYFTQNKNRDLDPLAKGRPCEAAIALALGAGLRVGEILDMRRRSVNLQESRVTIEGGKTAASRRQLPIPAFAVDALRSRTRGLRTCAYFRRSDREPTFFESGGLRYARPRG